MVGSLLGCLAMLVQFEYLIHTLIAVVVLGIHPQHYFFYHSINIVFPVPEESMCACELWNMIIQAPHKFLQQAGIIGSIVENVDGYNLFGCYQH